MRLVPPIGVFLVIDRSTLRNPGPYTAFLGRLPKWNVPSGDTGIANTDDAVHDPVIRGSQAALSNHRVGSPTTFNVPIRSGRSVLTTPLNVVTLVTRFTGFPVCACTMPPICHPSAKALPVNGSM